MRSTQEFYDKYKRMSKEERKQYWKRHPMRLTPATNKAVELQLLKILNRWHRKYPAYTLTRRRSGCSPKDARIETMYEDIGFLLQVVNKGVLAMRGDGLSTSNSATTKVSRTVQGK